MGFDILLVYVLLQVYMGLSGQKLLAAELKLQKLFVFQKSKGALEDN